MPATGKQHWYYVAILSYNSHKAMAMAQRGEDIGFGHIRSQVTYSGENWAEARHELGLAVARASRLKLAYRVHVLRDYKEIIRVNIEHLS